LIHAPTGSGKTLAALGGPMIEAIARRAQANDGLSILWVTPLRALAADLIVQLEAPLHDLGIPWRVLRRTGDSGSGERTKLKAGLVEVLVTTPESLALQLSYEDAGSRLGTLGSIVVDEWHELLGSKRGVLFELGLARLRQIAPGARIWGLSATIGNLEEAMLALLGPGRPGHLIAVRGSRPMVIETALPPRIERFAWAGHLGLSQLPLVVEVAGAAGSVLVFTNTRSQAELWREAIASVWPHAPEALAIHHGSLDRDLRRKVRQALDEVCERMFNFARLQATLEEMKTRILILQRPAALTPFGFPLWSEWVRGGLSSEDWEARVQRLAEQLEKQAR
jgi:ATP-dependent helicase Lhr and Lhr-like helicase